LENQVRSETIHAFGIAAEHLTRFYTDDGRYDLAEKYLAYTILLESNRSTDLYDELRKRLIASKHSPIDDANFVKKHFNPKLLESYKAPNIHIDTDRGSLTLSDKVRDATLLLFYSSECSICKTAIPSVLKGISTAMSPQTRIIILTDLPKSALDAAIGRVPCKYEYATFQSEVISALKIPGFPYAVVIRDGNVKYSGSVDATFSASKFAALL
jgi:hypothetical protein